VAEVEVTSTLTKTLRFIGFLSFRGGNNEECDIFVERRVVLNERDVSEEYLASIFRAEE
jgi:hypothetical protein